MEIQNILRLTRDRDFLNLRRPIEETIPPQNNKMSIFGRDRKGFQKPRPQKKS
jgi:hypothetical protein